MGDNPKKCGSKMWAFLHPYPQGLEEAGFKPQGDGEGREEVLRQP